MRFHSILFRRPEAEAPAAESEPEFFRDLNLDQIVAAVTAGSAEYDLKPFFHQPLDDADDIAYRQAVMQDLERPPLRAAVGAFAEKMRQMRSHLHAAAEHYYPRGKQRWFVDAVAVYCAAVRQLQAELSEAEPRSSGFGALLDYLGRYTGSDVFTRLADDSARVQKELGAVRYCVLIRGLSVTVSRYQDEADYSAEIERDFAKFRQGDVKDYRVNYPDVSGMSHVDSQILDLVAKLYKDVFANIDQFCSRYAEFRDPILGRYDREVQFYVSYLRYIDRIRDAGLPFCYPNIGRQAKEVDANEIFDLALADKLVGEDGTVVVNDFSLRGRERVIIVSGPNQGGKTTFARAVGQLHYLARLGCPVPGARAQLFLCDRLFTHFERQESLDNLRGKLLDDLLRIRDVLDKATPNSLIVLNEIFASTALEDAVSLASAVMRRIIALDCLCVCVSFLDELAAQGDSVASMVGTIVPDNPTLRTFKLVRRPADGRAYAMAIAEKYRLDPRSLKRRLAS